MSDPISIELILEDGKFVANLKKNGQVLNTLSSEVTKADRAVRKGQEGISKYAHGIRGLAVDIGLLHHSLLAAKQVLFSWQDSIIKANAQFEKSRVLMEGMEKGVDDVTRALRGQANVNFMIQKAMSNPFGIEAIQDAMVKLKSVGIDPTNGAIAAMTGDFEEMKRSMESGVDIQALLDAVARFGGSEDQLKRASIAIQQMAGKGVISMEELRQQLGEAIPNAVQVMADAVGMTYAELVKNISTGRVQAKPALMLFFQELEAQVGGSAENMMQTWDGMLAQFNTSLDVFQKNIGDAGYMDALKRELEAITEFLNSEAGMNLAEDIGEGLTMLLDGFRSLREWLAENEELVMALGEAAKVALGMFVVSKAIAGVQALSVSMGSLVGIAKGVKTDFGMLALVVTSFAGDVGKASGTVGKLSTMLGLGRIALSALGGPIGIVIGGLATLYLMWGDESDKIEENTAELLENAKARGVLTEETTKQLAAQQEKVKAEIAELKELANQKMQEMKRNRGDNWLSELQNDSWFQATNDKIRRLQAQLVDLNKETERGVAQLADRSSRRIIESLERQMKDSMKPLRDAYRQQLDDMQKALGTEERDAAIAKRDKLQAEALQEKIRLTKEYVAEREKLLAKAQKDGDAQGAAVEEEVIDKLKAKLAQLQEQALMSKDALYDAVLGDPSVNAGGAKQGTIGQAIEQLKAKLRETREQLDGVAKEAARAEGKIEAMFSGAKPEEIAQYKKLAGEADKAIAALNGLKKAQRESAKSSETLAALNKRTAQDMAYVNERLKDPFGPDMSARLRNVYSEASRLTELAKELAAISMSAGNPSAFSGQIQALMDLAEGWRKAGDELRKAELSAELVELTQQSRDWAVQSLDSKDQLMMAYWADVEAMQSLRDEMYKAGTLTAEHDDYIKSAMDNRRRLYTSQSKSDLERLGDDWADVSSQMEAASVKWAQGSADALTDFVMTGKLEFKSLAESIIRDLIRIQIQQQLAGLVGSLGASIFGNGGSMSVGSPGSFDVSAPGNIQMAPGSTAPTISAPATFAMGGIMTDMGSVPLRKYANGGIATSPQLAMFGEGSTPEAYVPLPDGRSIPVTMKGGDQSGANVQVNVINQSGQQVEAEESGRRFDGQKMILDVVLKAANSPGPFRNGMKEAMRK